MTPNANVSAARARRGDRRTLAISRPHRQPLVSSILAAQEIPREKASATLATIWRLASPFFVPRTVWAGRLLLAAVIAIELSIVGITVLLNTWNNAFTNALQDRNWDAFVTSLVIFSCWPRRSFSLPSIQLYLNQWLQIRWRRWMTRSYLDHGLPRQPLRMQLLGDAPTPGTSAFPTISGCSLNRPLNIVSSCSCSRHPASSFMTTCGPIGGGAAAFVRHER